LYATTNPNPNTNRKTEVKGTVHHEEYSQVYKPLKSVTYGQCDARLTVTYLVTGHHCHTTAIKLYCLVTEGRV